ncbi:hypothetical protein BUALT_Bualt02G0100300 [Buddleja alternifolia]|uniref:Pectinesterase inhibitor domain-containing protein n=1 Tax=Buddleja alternifolia TaxID=168488 RepID=A0AAV6Y9P0_9LAMI|nr:hypothetical protein BUALT_Bualt02G0100300 [Buddleja alternifolia]
MGSTICSLMAMLVLFLLIPHSSGDTQGLIIQICRQTDDFYFCRDVFNKHLFTRTTDIVGLTQIAVTQSLIYASNTRILISRSEANEKNKNKQNLYKICESGYEILVNEFTDANFAFARRDYSTVIFDVEKCPRFVNDCQSVLGSQGRGKLQQRFLELTAWDMAYIGDRAIEVKRGDRDYVNRFAQRDRGIFENGLVDGRRVKV